MPLSFWRPCWQARPTRLLQEVAEAVAAERRIPAVAASMSAVAVVLAAESISVVALVPAAASISAAARVPAAEFISAAFAAAADLV